MPLFKARVTQRSPTLDKILNGGTNHGNNHCHQNGNETDQEATDTNNGARGQKNSNPQTQEQQQRRSSKVSRPPMVFHCQLAHGSPTGLISGFRNVRELYQKIAERYDMSVEEVSSDSRSCTVNDTGSPRIVIKKIIRILFVIIDRMISTDVSTGYTALWGEHYSGYRKHRLRAVASPVSPADTCSLAACVVTRIILFCTLNTHKIEMTELLGSQIGVGDFIFAHKKGRPKEIELVKSDDALGLTITDNGAGYAFIKRIKEGSIIDRIKVIEVGDHIEKIDSNSLIGKRHFEVARMLKEIPKGSTFTLRLVEPLKNGFGSIGPRGDLKKGKKSGYGSGKETLRFKADGSAQIIETIDDAATIGIEKINVILESFMGIYDTELATQIWELSECKSNSIEFAEAIDNSDLEAFGFTDDFVIELWGAVTDARAGRHR
ncbi:PDZ domain-containing protein GIPC1 [Dufourea novaeangliae]|uniref:PDZ domain-containing protein GIPC1 n=1 Tax=Dufourea novaeangliae TaxID=178035 RepID=A0A154PBK9_DUFNO|nr:PDZ domain-containing protein GIPC1 [Dufourea novaeangliae]